MFWNTFMFFIPMLYVDRSLAKAICPGFCIPEDMCESQNGRVLGFCTTGKACCDVPHNLNNQTDCGKVVNATENDTEAFASPDYPHYQHGSLICSYEIQVPEKVVALRLDLVRFELDGVSVAAKSDGRPGINCDADMFFVKGFSNWMTDARCGHLTGYSVIIDLDLSQYPENKVVLLFIMSSKSYRWKIKINPITSRHLRKSELCLQTRMETWSKSPHYPPKLPLPHHLQPNSTTLSSSSNDIRHPSQPFRAPWEAWIFAGNLTEACNTSPTRGSYRRRPCKATIVDDRHLLTTFSCLLRFQNIPLGDLKIVRGSPCDSNVSYLYTVEKIFIHFNYLSTLKSNDIAMIRTKKSLVFNKLTQPIPILLSDTNSQTHPKSDPKYILYSQTTPVGTFSQSHLSMTSNGPSQGLCQFGLAYQSQLTEEDFTALESSSNKYKELSQRSVCLLPETFSWTGNSKDSLLESPASAFPNLPLGTPLLSAGKQVIVHAIFNYFQRNIAPQPIPEISYRHYNNASMHRLARSNQKQYHNVTSIAYFTNLTFYKRWLLIAVS